MLLYVADGHVVIVLHRKGIVDHGCVFAVRIGFQVQIPSQDALVLFACGGIRHRC